MGRFAKKKKSGFTLIEVLMTISLIMIIMLPLYQFVQSAQETSLRAKRKQESGSIGQSTLEQIENIDKFYSDEGGTYILIKNGNDNEKVYIKNNNVKEYDCNNNVSKDKFKIKVTSKKVDKYTYDYSATNTTDNRRKVTIYKQDDGNVNMDIFENYNSVITFLNNGRICFNNEDVFDKSYINGDELLIYLYEDNNGKYVYSLYDDSNCIRKDIKINKSNSDSNNTCKILLYFSETGARLSDGNTMEDVFKKPFNDNVTISIKNDIDKKVYFDVVKGKNVNGKINVKSKKDNLESQNNFSINKYDYSETNSTVKLGDLYEVKVEVYYQKTGDEGNKELLFTSKTTKNLVSD